MKLFISLLIIPLLAQAKLVKVKYQDDQIQKAKQVVKILEKKFFIPALLIKLEESQTPCLKDKKTIVHLCLNEASEIQMPWFDKERFDFTLSHIIEFPVIDLSLNETTTLKSTSGVLNEI